MTPDAQLAGLPARLKPRRNGYGLTGSFSCTSQTRPDAPQLDTSVGQVIPDVEIRIVDIRERGVHGGETGRLAKQRRNSAGMLEAALAECCK